MLVRGGRTTGGSGGAQMAPAQSWAIIVMVLIIGASIYMWRKGMLRSRAALVTIVGILAALIYVVVSFNNAPY